MGGRPHLLPWGRKGQERGELARRGLEPLDQPVFQEKQAQWRRTVSRWSQELACSVAGQFPWRGSPGSGELLWDLFFPGKDGSAPQLGPSAD